MLFTKYYLGDRIKKNEMGEAFSTHGERRGVYGILVQKPEGKRPLGKPRCRWEDNIKMDLQEVGWGSMDWIELAQNIDRWAGNVCGRGEMHTGFWWGDLRERDHLEEIGLDGRIILKWIFKKWDEEAWTGLICLRIGTGGWLL